MLTNEQKRLLELRAEAEAQNPVLFFKPHSQAQHDFLAAHTPIQAAFCGNQFGKTCASVVKAFIQHLPNEVLPNRLKPYKRVTHTDPVVGWLDCPSAGVMESVIKPELRKWAPKDWLLGNSFDRAYDKQNKVLRFKDGGRLHLFSFEMDADKLVGAQVDYVIFDEPPPKDHWDEAMPRTLRRGGCRVLALTPVNMSGGAIGWLYRDIFLNQDDPDITVVEGAMEDNTLLPPEEIARLKRLYAGDPQLEARLYGRFVHLGGMVYPGGFEGDLVIDFPPNPKTIGHVQDLEVVVGIDPGLKNASFVWVGFDKDNHALVFDEVRLNEKTPVDYAAAIFAVNRKWGLRNPLYVIDPSARNRSLVNRESVQAELQRHGIPCIPGQNQVEAGVQQIRRRIEMKHFLVSRDLTVLRGEAREYRMQDRIDGEFAVVKERDHALDALRYACMSRPFYPWPEEDRKPLGWDPSTDSVAQPSKWLRGVPNVGPLGSWA